MVLGDRIEFLRESIRALSAASERSQGGAQRTRAIPLRRAANHKIEERFTPSILRAIAMSFSGDDLRTRSRAAGFPSGSAGSEWPKAQRGRRRSSQLRQANSESVPNDSWRSRHSLKARSHLEDGTKEAFSLACARGTPVDATAALTDADVVMSVPPDLGKTGKITALWSRKLDVDIDATNPPDWYIPLNECGA